MGRTGREQSRRLQLVITTLAMAGRTLQVTVPAGGWATVVAPGAPVQPALRNPAAMPRIDIIYARSSLARSGASGGAVR